ncbi:MAG: hypothetical protein DHS20C18_52210 [Saprospiraceae bacterium]|nr:MAG: hypothetical protein DHS20C18_52210 [Saprospiraceae bacterium]
MSFFRNFGSFKMPSIINAKCFKYWGGYSTYFELILRDKRQICFQLAIYGNYIQIRERAMVKKRNNLIPN